MKEKVFCVDIYNTKIHLLQVQEGDSYENIPDVFKDRIIENEILEDIETWFDSESEALNAGYTITNYSHIYVIFSKFSSIRQQVNTYYHELRHVVDSILEYREIDDREAAAYLQGHVGEHFHDFLVDNISHCL